MNKTPNPEKYLKQASQIIQTAHNLGIKVKLNILLYAGETQRTLNETLSWLHEHSKFITGVSVGPVIVFGWEHKNKDYLRDLKSKGASYSHSPIKGITHINLSKEISFDDSLQLSSEIGQRFCDSVNYYELKAFSYFSRDYSYSEFLNDSIAAGKGLNYRLNDVVELTE